MPGGVNPGAPSAFYAPLTLTQGLGGLDDSVKLTINDTQLLTAISWSVHEGILSQPAKWTFTCGSGDIAQQLLKTFQPGPKFKFKLYIGNVLQQSGYLDTVETDQPVGGATSVTLSGRDALAKLQDTYVKAAIGANVSTYAQLVWFALQQCGMVSGSTIDPNILRTDNAANRNIKSGVTIPAVQGHRTVQQILDDVTVAGSVSGQITSKPSARIHETWHRFIRRHIDRAGLMFWAAADGTFVLTLPDGQQSPTYLLRRKTGEATSSTRGNVIAAKYRDDRTHRHSEVIVYAKGGGKALGRVKGKGGFVDEEMVASGYDQPIVVRDSNCHSVAEAILFARRKLAEERRSGWNLQYTVNGHTLPYAGDNGKSRAVIIPDTVVAVDDDELGLTDRYYLESLDRQRHPETSTVIRLMRLEDLIFGSDEESD
jgi:prophage tail gpP-like protein